MRYISSVGAMKMRINPLGNANTSRVQTTLKHATEYRAYFSVSFILSHFPAPKQMEKIGCDAWPTLYAQHWTMVLILTITPYTDSALPPRYFII